MKESVQFRLLGILVCGAIALLQATLVGQETVNVEQSGTIVSERETVDLVGDSNISEAVNRRPELQFNNVTIDGEVSDISLSDLPSEAVSSLEVLRAITPDLDADARGGSLNVESKPTFQLKERSTKAEVSLSFDEMGSRWGRSVSFSDSQSFGSFGYRLGLSAASGDSYDESLSMDWLYLGEAGVYAPRYLSTEIEESESDEYSITSRFDYKASERLSFFARIDYDQENYKEYNPASVFRFNEGEYLNPKYSSGLSQGARLERDLLGFNSRETGRFWQLGAVSEYEKLRFDLKLSVEQSRYFEPNWFVIDLKQDDVDLEYDWINPRQINVSTSTPSSASDFGFDELLDEQWRNDQDDTIVTFNAKRTFETKKVKGFLKGGLKYRSREKNQVSDSHIHNRVLGGFNMLLVEGDFQASSEINPGNELGPFIGIDESRDYFFGNRDKFPLNIRRTRENSDGSSYYAQEDISSAYGMVSAEFGKFRGILGGRLERTDLTFEASEVVIGEDGSYQETLPKMGENGYSHFFPSAHLRYYWGDRTTVIAAWTKSIQRPFYGSIVPYRKINYSNQSIETGNPELQPTLYDNIDLSIDYKLGKESTLALEFFNRDISDLVFWEVNRVVSGEFAGFDLGSNQNGPSASKSGVNFIWNQPFGEWNSKLNHWSMNVKASYVDSKSEYPNRPDVKLPAVYAPKQSIQVSLTYDNDKLYAQLLYKDADNRLNSVDNFVWRDRYRTGRELLEFSTSYKLNASTRIFLEIDNMLGTPHESYAGDLTRPTYFGLAKPEYELGLKKSF